MFTLKLIQDKDTGNIRSDDRHSYGGVDVQQRWAFSHIWGGEEVYLSEWELFAQAVHAHGWTREIREVSHEEYRPKEIQEGEEVRQPETKRPVLARAPAGKHPRVEEVFQAWIWDNSESMLSKEADQRTKSWQELASRLEMLARTMETELAVKSQVASGTSEHVR